MIGERGRLRTFSLTILFVCVVSFVAFLPQFYLNGGNLSSVEQNLLGFSMKKGIFPGVFPGIISNHFFERSTELFLENIFFAALPLFLAAIFLENAVHSIKKINILWLIIPVMIAQIAAGMIAKGSVGFTDPSIGLSLFLFYISAFTLVLGIFSMASLGKVREGATAVALSIIPVLFAFFYCDGIRTSCSADSALRMIGLLFGFLFGAAFAVQESVN